MRKITITLAAVASLLTAVPAAHAATTAQAAKAVKAEVKDVYGYSGWTTCRKLTTTRFTCTWGTTNGVVNHKGTARVRFYGRNADVTGVR